MIKITAEIVIIDDEDNIKEVSGFAYQPHTNVSVRLGNTFGTTSKTSNIFLLAGAEGGGTKLDDGSVFSADNVNYYLSRAMSGSVQESEEDGGGYSLGNSYVDIIVSPNKDVDAEAAITIIFDEENSGYATKINVSDGDASGHSTTYINHSTTFQAKLKLKYPFDGYIRILSWNKPFAPIIISSIYERLTYKITDKKMISCEFELNEKADPTLPSFGVISNDGSIEFRDYDGSFLELIEQGRLKDKKEVVFELENTYDKKKREISTFLTSDVQYDDDSQIADIQLIDNLVAMQDVKDVRVYLQKNKTMLDVYHTLVELSTPLGYTFADIDNDEEFADLKSYLTNITLQYFFLQRDTLWAQWQKFCEATGLYMYINKENKIVLGSEFDFSMEG